MKASSYHPIILGYLLLLIVNCIEIRSGVLLAAVQFSLGLFLFLPYLKSDGKTVPDISHRNWVAWVYLLVLFVSIYLYWFDTPNHFFLFTLLSILLILNKEQSIPGFFRDNLRWVFVVLMGFATIHKLIHPNFLGGDFIGLRLVVGNFFRLIWVTGILPEMGQIVAQNANSVTDLATTDPNLGTKILLEKPLAAIEWISKSFTYLIVIAEFALCMLFIFWWRKKITMFSLWLFICSIAIIVSEFEFISTLLFVGFVLCPSDWRSLKSLYRWSFFVFCGISIAYNFFQHFKAFL